MGGRGSSSYSGGGGGGSFGSNVAPGVTAQGNINNQAPNASNTPVLPGGVTELTKMTDDELTNLYRQSQNVDMPNHLKDASDATQRFVYTAGLNEKPTVLDDASFNQYLRDNNISRSEILARSVNGAQYTVNGTTIRLSADQVSQMTKYSDLNYIGGKHGGQAYGAGTYFDQNGGIPTGYAGGATMIGVLSKNAHKISYGQLQSRTQTWAQSHPNFVRTVGRFNSSTASIYALAQGYNVITDGYSYHNVIDRSALVMRQSNY